ncbi:MAG: 23S rRNA (uracil(1939)-C(5))-methyltransferase RlmD, partial [Myxococcota bacterium]|nr:23S rRNA (uracil(1939)-C(5))-methyltransferase RlmD [Myxococcota bacterium]
PWQSASESLQRRTKEAAVDALLGEFYDPQTQRHGWVGPSATVGYRTRAMMVTRHRAGTIRMGFYAPRTQQLVPAEPCVVQHPRVNAVLKAVRRVLRACDWPTWRSAERPGLLRGVLYRVDPSVGDGLLTLIISQPLDDRVRDAARPLLSIEGVCGVYVNVNGADGGPMLGAETIHLRGKHRQVVSWGELTLQVGPTAFLQTNHEMATALVDLVGRWLPARAEHLVDLYAGVGVLGLAHRDRAKRVTLVESAPAAIDDARRNIATLGAAHVTLVGEDAARVVDEVLDPAVDAVILDPPRAGCAPEVIAAVAGLEGLVTVVYVSCEARTLARDLRRLVDAGYRVRDVASLDMFVHTPHVEVAVALVRGD